MIRMYLNNIDIPKELQFQADYKDWVDLPVQIQRNKRASFAILIGQENTFLRIKRTRWIIYTKSSIFKILSWSRSRIEFYIWCNLNAYKLCIPI